MASPAPILNKRMIVNIINEQINRINKHMTDVVIPGGEYVGNLTISVTFKPTGEPVTHYSIAGMIAPLYVVEIIQALVTELMETKAIETVALEVN